MSKAIIVTSRNAPPYSYRTRVCILEGTYEGVWYYHKSGGAFRRSRFSLEELMTPEWNKTHVNNFKLNAPIK